MMRGRGAHRALWGQSDAIGPCGIAGLWMSPSILAQGMIAT